ncbi:multisubunit Na+/H+ antiporter MnhC subunit [Allocatelliglobosispora scoriae]|uniref:Multisubunit Na+/H+ antiporter MnhC subunit n=1 Tax=Allocatelliglobosispora scoriae TaxID=643052 RepID=A0A841BV51_9ACTN|nr:hypothetical protein [Allocatelliglobosispora scoriae]MBB5870632.1 multisubunit Na+/H+ antiporter MnhC subunit [Allocatelliglobosispora scoriae]
MSRNSDDKPRESRGRRDPLQRGSRGVPPSAPVDTRPAPPARRDDREDARGRGRRPAEPRVPDTAPPPTVERGMYGQVLGTSGSDDSEAAEIPMAPVRRLLSLFIAGFSALLALGLIFGAQTAGVGAARIPYAIVIFGVQVLFVLAWTMAIRPPGMREVAGVALATAAAADLAAVLPEVAGVTMPIIVGVVGFIFGVVGQLWRREARMRVTEAIGSALVLTIGVISFSTLVVLTRVELGTQAIVISLTSTGVALLLARLMDTVAPWPRIAPQVPRGALGVVVGGMAGTLCAAFLGRYIVGFDPKSAAYVGLAAAGAAILADLAVGFAEAGRELAGEPPTMWLARHMQGPLGGFALAAPVAYAISVLFLT